MDKARVLLEHFKQHLRLTSNDLDSELTQKLLASVEAAEHHIGKTIVPSLLVDARKFSSKLVLRAPVMGVESVRIDGEELSSDDYELDGQVLALKTAGNKVEVTYRSGYACIPADMMAAIMLHAASLYNNPLDRVEALPKASDALLRPYRSWGVVNDGE